MTRRARAMTDAEVAAHLRAYVTDPANIGRQFSWPTDGCGYDQHIRFVHHRNASWNGGTPEEWTAFVLAYADSLVPSPVEVYRTDANEEVERMAADFERQIEEDAARWRPVITSGNP